MLDMTKAAQSIFEQAMALEYEERAELVEMLSGSLELSTDPEYVAAWDAEIKRRIDEVEAGTAKLIPVDEFLKHLREGRFDADDAH